MKLNDLIKVYGYGMNLYVNKKYEGHYTFTEDFIRKGNPEYLDAEVIAIEIAGDDNSLEVRAIMEGK